MPRRVDAGQEKYVLSRSQLASWTVELCSPYSCLCPASCISYRALCELPILWPRVSMVRWGRPLLVALIVHPEKPLLGSEVDLSLIRAISAICSPCRTAEDVKQATAGSSMSMKRSSWYRHFPISRVFGLYPFICLSRTYCVYDELLLRFDRTP